MCTYQSLLLIRHDDLVFFNIDEDVLEHVLNNFLKNNREIKECKELHTAPSPNYAKMFNPRVSHLVKISIPICFPQIGLELLDSHGRGLFADVLVVLIDVEHDDGVS